MRTLNYKYSALVGLAAWIVGITLACNNTQCNFDQKSLPAMLMVLIQFIVGSVILFTYLPNMGRYFYSTVLKTRINILRLVYFSFVAALIVSYYRLSSLSTLGTCINFSILALFGIIHTVCLEKINTGLNLTIPKIVVAVLWVFAAAALLIFFAYWIILGVFIFQFILLILSFIGWKLLAWLNRA